MLKTPRLLIGLLLLTSCAAPGQSEPTVAPSSNPCTFITLPAIDQPTRAALADEISAAPASARWPEQVQAYIAMRAAVRACQETK